MEDLGELGLDPDRGELAGVAANLVDADRGDHLLDPLAQGRAEIGDVVLVVVDADHLEHHVGADAVRAEAEGDHHVVDVADRRRAQHDRAAATQVLAVGDLVLLERLVDRGGRQVGVDVAPLGVIDGAVGEDQQLAALADGLDRLVPEPLDRALGRLGLEQGDVDRLGPAPEGVPEVLEQIGPLLARDAAVGAVRERRQVVMTAQDHGEVRLDRLAVGGGVAQRRATAEDRARREVLDLALTVDRGVGDDRHRLLEVVGQVLALR